jgi:hypothetical protein
MEMSGQLNAAVALSHHYLDTRAGMDAVKKTKNPVLASAGK